MEKRRSPRIRADLGTFAWRGQLLQIENASATGISCRGAVSDSVGALALGRSHLWRDANLLFELVRIDPLREICAFALSAESAAWIFWYKTIFLPLRAGASISLLGHKPAQDVAFREMWYYGEDITLQISGNHRNLTAAEFTKHGFCYQWDSAAGWSVRENDNEQRGLTNARAELSQKTRTVTEAELVWFKVFFAAFRRCQKEVPWDFELLTECKKVFSRSLIKSAKSTLLN